MFLHKLRVIHAGLTSRGIRTKVREEGIGKRIGWAPPEERRRYFRVCLVLDILFENLANGMVDIQERRHLPAARSVDEELSVEARPGEVGEPLDECGELRVLRGRIKGVHTV